MRFKEQVKQLLKGVLIKRGYTLVPSELVYEWQKEKFTPSGAKIQREVREEDKNYLKLSNPRFTELCERYSEFDKTVTDSLVWVNGYLTQDEVIFYRGDNGYVWQLRGQNMNELAYHFTYYYLLSVDHLGLFSKLNEDGAFGNFTFEIANKTISRDLLDSINEIIFLERTLKISSRKTFRVLDIGAGYGRLAHRMLTTFENIDHYVCTDAVPTSTFICEHYLRHRKLEGRAKVVPLDEFKGSREVGNIDLAINIHSFSECTLSAIEWWIKNLSDLNVPKIFIVPNTGNKLALNSGEDFSFILEKYGYMLKSKEPKYAEKLVQRYGINPTYYYLFERNN